MSRERGGQTLRSLQREQAQPSEWMRGLSGLLQSRAIGGERSQTTLGRTGGHLVEDQQQPYRH